MRKKIILTVCLIVMAITFGACSAANTVSGTDSDSVIASSLEKIPVADKVKVIVEDGDSLYNPQSLEEVEGLAEYVVRGKLLDDAKQKLDRHGSTPVFFGVTVSSFEISKVYKGNLKSGDKIQIAERYFTLEEDGITTRHELDYAPSVPNQEYIFFLIKGPDKNEFLRGLYSPMVKETGRYAILTPKDSNFSKMGLMSANELNLVKTEPSTYQKIYNQVIDKYMK